MHSFDSSINIVYKFYIYTPRPNIFIEEKILVNMGLAKCNERTVYTRRAERSDIFVRVQRGRAIARSSKNIFRSYSSDRLSY